MKKVIVFALFVWIVSLWGQTGNSQFGLSTSFSISEDSAKAASEENVMEIMEHLNVIQYTYLRQLSKDDYRSSVKIMNEIRRLLGAQQVETSEEAVQDVNTNVGIQDETSQSVNINMDFSGFGNSTQQQTQTTQVVTPVEDTKKPMDSSAFNRLLSNVEDESFADDQMRYIRSAAKDHYFSVNQISQLIDVFTFGDDKLECLRITYARVTNKEDGFELISKFTYADEKEVAEDIINQ